MGSRRLGRRRLYSLEKRGQSLTETDLGPGAGAKGAIQAAFQHREGAVIVTEIWVDLLKGSFESHGANAVIGKDGTDSGTLFQWTESLFGQLLDVDLMITEDLAGGAVNIILASNSAAINVKSGGNSNTDHCSITDADKGDNVSATDIAAVGSDNVHFYLYSAQSTDAAYTAGKMIIRVTGYAVSEF